MEKPVNKRWDNWKNKSSLLYRDKNWLTEQYWGFNLYPEEMAKLSNCTYPTIVTWLKKYNIPLVSELDVVCRERTKRKISKSNKGRIRTKEWKNNLSKAKKGKRYKTDDKISVYWKHVIVKKQKPRPIFETCEMCGEVRKLELANIKNHIYTTNPDDYIWLCHRCHSDFDGTTQKFINATLKRNKKGNKNEKNRRNT